METLRNTFDAEARELGLTFTAPSSFWYLRWFDLPGLMKHADWVNLVRPRSLRYCQSCTNQMQMSYDLHGTWDRNNPM